MNKTIVLRGPLKAFPTVEALLTLGYDVVGSGSIEVYRVEKTLNTLIVTPDKLVSIAFTQELVNDPDYDVHVLTPKKDDIAYISSDRWLELGGKRAEKKVDSS